MLVLWTHGRLVKLLVDARTMEKITVCTSVEEAREILRDIFPLDVLPEDLGGTRRDPLANVKESEEDDPWSSFFFFCQNDTS